MSNSLKYVIGDQNIEKLAMDSRQEKMDKRENQKKEHLDFIEEVGKNKDLEEKIRGIIDEYLSSSTQSLAPELTDAKINFDSLNRTSPIKNIPAAVAVKHRAADSCDSDELIDKKYYELIARVTATHDEPPIITFDDIKHSIPYLPNFPAKFGVHIGQRKLFLSEIQFITECGDDVDYVIYAGAAPSHKGFLMWNLFPKKKFILIDPNKFELYIYDQPHQAIGAAKYSQYIRYLRSSYSAGEKNGFNESELDAARIARTALSSTTKLVPEGRTALSSTTKLVPKGRTSRSADDTPVHSAGINLAVRDSDVPLDEWLDVIRDSPQHIFLAEEYFTVDIAKVLSKLDCIFISDIRTRVHTEKPADTDILWNSAQQLNWIKILEPRACFLKFRTPYFESSAGHTAPMSMDNFEDFQRADLIMAKEKHGIDFIGNFNNNIFEYFKGTVYIQAWPGKSSSESRLLIRAEDINNYVRYDQVEYENKFFYYNCVARMLVHHRNVYASEKEGFDHCNDCALEAHIWQRYMEKYVAPANRDIRVFLNALHLSISRNLFMHGHGYFFRHNINYLRKKLNFSLY